MGMALSIISYDETLIGKIVFLSLIIGFDNNQGLGLENLHSSSFELG